MSQIFADDYSYSFSWETGKMINGLYDIIQSQYKHWLIWGGRSVAHSLVQLFLYLGKDIFNFFNAFIFILDLSGRET